MIFLALLAFALLLIVAQAIAALLLCTNVRPDDSQTSKVLDAQQVTIMLKRS